MASSDLKTSLLKDAGPSTEPIPTRVSVLRSTAPSPKRRKDLEHDGGAAARLLRAAEISSNKFRIMLVLTGSYLIAELSLGIIAGSLALLADALHMFTDLAQLAIGWWVANISHRERTAEMPFGWQRAEIVSGLANGCFLLAVCFTISIEALQKLVGIGANSNAELETNSLYVVVIGCVGLVINLGGMCIFGAHGHSHGGAPCKHSSGGDHGHAHKNKPPASLPSSRGPNGDDRELRAVQVDSNIPEHGHNGHCAEIDPGHSGGHGADHGHSHAEGHSHGGHGDDTSAHGHSHEGGGCEGHGHDEGHGHGHGLEHGSASDGHDCGHAHGHDDVEEEEEHGHGHGHGHGGGHGHSHSHGHGGHGQEKETRNLNEYSMYLHVMGDALGSLSVVVTMLVIHFGTSLGDARFLADPICSLFIVVIILTSTIPLVKETAHLLMESAPALLDGEESMTVERLKARLEELQDVLEIHELHVWRFTHCVYGLHTPEQTHIVEGLKARLEELQDVLEIHELHVWRFAHSKIVCTMHVVVDRGCTDIARVVDKIKGILHANGVHSSTIQIEAASEAEMLRLGEGGVNCADLVCDTCDLHGWAPPAPLPSQSPAGGPGR